MIIIYFLVFSCVCVCFFSNSLAFRTFIHKKLIFFLLLFIDICHFTSLLLFVFSLFAFQRLINLLHDIYLQMKLKKANPVYNILFCSLADFSYSNNIRKISVKRKILLLIKKVSEVYSKTEFNRIHILENGQYNGNVVENGTL